MSYVERTRKQVAVEDIPNTDKMFFRQIGMKEEKALKKFGEQIDTCIQKVNDGIVIETVYESFPIEKIKDDRVYLENGLTMESKMLASVLEKSDEMLLCVISALGYDEVEDAEESTLNILFVDGWGSSIVERGHDMVKKMIQAELKKRDLHTTASWSPGQHDVDIKIQEPLFDMLNPEEIGVELSDSFMMHPKKSVSAIMGIGGNKDQAQVRACDHCGHRETCPSAYSDQI